MSKSADAFRTISEVAEWLDTPAHVLRFWESKFTQVKPVKRAGGRRYYRPADMRLLGGIKKLLHEDGMTIKGVQKILREQGIKHVASICVLSVGDEQDEAEVILEDVAVEEPIDTVVPFAKPDAARQPEAADEPELVIEAASDALEENTLSEMLELDLGPVDVELPTDETAPDVVTMPDSEEPSEPVKTEDAEAEQSEQVEEVAALQADDGTEETSEAPPEDRAAALPAFLQRPMEVAHDAPVKEIAQQAQTPAPPALDNTPSPNVLTSLSRIRSLPPHTVREIAPLVDKLRAMVG